MQPIGYLIKNKVKKDQEQNDWTTPEDKEGQEQKKSREIRQL